MKKTSFHSVLDFLVNLGLEPYGYFYQKTLILWGFLKNYEAKSVWKVEELIIKVFSKALTPSAAIEVHRAHKPGAKPAGKYQFYDTFGGQKPPVFTDNDFHGIVALLEGLIPTEIRMTKNFGTDFAKGAKELEESICDYFAMYFTSPNPEIAIERLEFYINDDKSGDGFEDYRPSFVKKDETDLVYNTGKGLIIGWKLTDTGYEFFIQLTTLANLKMVAKLFDDGWIDTPAVKYGTEEHDATPIDNVEATQ